MRTRSGKNMEFKGTRLIIMMLITFVIVFLMNYLGNSDAPDRIMRALMTGFAGAVGLGIGMWFIGRKKGDQNNHPDFE